MVHNDYFYFRIRLARTIMKKHKLGGGSGHGGSYGAAAAAAAAVAAAAKVLRLSGCGKEADLPNVF